MKMFVFWLKFHWNLFPIDNEAALYRWKATSLTHLPQDKMAAILQTTFFKCIFLNEKIRFLTKISLKYVAKGPTDNNPALV